MTKLGVKYARELATADPARITANSNLIAATFPKDIPREAIDEYISQAATAIDNYLAFLPTGISLRRKHRASGENSHIASAHRPRNSLRHGLIGELYDAYMDVRKSDGDSAPDPDRVRGFKGSADAILIAAGLPPVSEREQRHIREQIKTFAQAFADEEVSRQK